MAKKRKYTKRHKLLAPTKSRSILQTLPSSGSSHGWSKLEAWLGCIHRAWLDERAKAAGDNDSHRNPETMVGTIYHAFQDYAVTLQDNTYNASTVEFHQSGPATNIEEYRDEAQRAQRRRPDALAPRPRASSRIRRRTRSETVPVLRQLHELR